MAGYGWFLRRMADEDVRYAWGYGGQILYVAPHLGLTVVMTSDDTPRSTSIADRNDLHALCGQIVQSLRLACPRRPTRFGTHLPCAGPRNGEPAMISGAKGVARTMPGRSVRRSSALLSGRKCT